MDAKKMLEDKKKDEDKIKTKKGGVMLDRPLANGIFTSSMDRVSSF